MIEPIRKLVARRLPAALCLLAAAMQVGLPALHAPHSASIRPEVVAAGGAAVLIDARNVADEGPHDPASCSQCRLVSQLKSLAPLSVVAALPAIEARWLGATPAAGLLSHAGHGTGAPRAPPFLA